MSDRLAISAISHNRSGASDFILAAFSRRCRAAALLLVFILASSPSPSPAAPPASEPKIRIAFAGDSLADNYWAGVFRVVAANSCLQNNLELGRFARISTGLARGDVVYWPREIRRIGDTFKPNAFLISIGLNDRQFIVDGSGRRTAWGAPDWIDKYRNEISELLKGAAAGQAVVLLVGLPVMRDSVDNADAIEKDKLFSETVAKLGASNVQYVEPWKLNASSADTFSSYGPDKNGRMIQIRTPDGQHFTTPGEDLLAAYTFPKIVGSLSEFSTRLGQCLSN
jgi:hypothetical protein